MPDHPHHPEDTEAESQPQTEDLAQVVTTPGGGALYVVATPIGNLEDITLRAIRTLKEADVIAAEDTRHSGNLLRHLGIRAPLVSCHSFNESRRSDSLLERIRAGQKVALISDAGTPGVSDPGALLIRACVDAGLRVEVIPGPSALITALVGSGFEPDAFHFGGFLPPKSGGRRKEFAAAALRTCATVFYESPHRLIRSLEDADEVLKTRRICVARELTKKFEEWRRGPAAELLGHFSRSEPRGEIVLVIAPMTREEEREHRRRERRGELPETTDTAEEAAEAE
ncbi:MAG: 16S rRNA (cytidine(1402)-2'-O)-methyltransferase [Candidatus Methylacidiphilales bacterium]|nr:16S rRNA (cytidine(1402)-2'-O)-methyltransferase [Candidatus Methylacidiphilales bacterium]